jgi:hypothetical protein
MHKPSKAMAVALTAVVYKSYTKHYDDKAKFSKNYD